MFKLAFSNLFRRKTRTFLALLGVAIGVCAIIVLVSIVDGLYLEFNETISQFQGISVLEKNAADTVFSVMDESFGEKLEGVSNVKAAVGEVWYVPREIDDKIRSINTFEAVSVYGLDVSKLSSVTDTGWIFSLDRGSTLKSTDTGFVLIGKNLANNFGKFVGSTIEIDDKKFRVKGIFSGSSDLIENVIAMNLDDARELSGIGSGNVSSFTLSLVDPAKADETVQVLEFSFPDDIKAYSATTFAGEVDAVLGNFRLLVFFVAAISSIVSGVGIVNTILMSIIERRKEIGTLKAVGWTKRNIVKLIVEESLLIGVFGGVFGIVLGFGVDVLLNQLVGLNYAITLPLVLQAFLFALFLGLIAGAYPAFKGASLDPIEALRG